VSYRPLANSNQTYHQRSVWQHGPASRELRTSFIHGGRAKPGA